MGDLGINELPPGRYIGVVEKIEYSGRPNIKVVLTYKVDTPDGIRRLKEKELISTPYSSTSYFNTTWGLTRVRDILRIKGLTLADAELRTLPKLLQGTALAVVTRNKRIGGFETPVVTRVEKP